MSEYWIIKRPSYNAIKRYKRYCLNKGLPLCEINDNMQTMFKRRGMYWVRSELSWY